MKSVCRSSPVTPLRHLRISWWDRFTPVQGAVMRFHRKTSPKVVGGKVQRKNRWRQEPDSAPPHQVRIERYKPRPGFRHFVSPADVTAFLGLLPDWHNLAVGLNRVVLSADRSCLGWFVPETVAVCAWEEECVQVYNP